MFEQLSTIAEDILKKSFGLEESVEWQPPQDRLHGDLATAVALRLAKPLGKNPREIAQALADELQKNDQVNRVDVAGAGYVNVWLKPSALLRELSQAESFTNAQPPRKGEAPVIVEYSQPNIAKPLAIHHLIGTALGQAVVNIYRHTGYPVISWNYVGDWGTQFGKLSVAYEKWGAQKPVLSYTLDELLSLYVKFHQEVEQDASLEDQGREAFRKLEAGDENLRAFWKDVVSVTKASLEGVYQRLHVSFDLDLGESFYEDKMGSILEEGRQKGVFIEGKEGALIVEFPEHLNMPPYLVQKGDGATLYSTRDIAQMRYRMDTYHPQAIYILTDIAQKLHFEQLVATCELLGWELPTFENILFGRMRFADTSMSTRKGNVMNLEHVLDEAVDQAKAVIKERGDAIQTDDPDDLAEMMGVGALVYGILSQNRKMDIVFSWEKMLSFEGNSAPYLMYTHARARSVLRKSLEGEGTAGVEVDVLSDHERNLIATLLQFPQVLEEARQTHMPHRLANFLYQLAQDFNAFYNVETILNAEDTQRDLRLMLTRLTADILRAGAGILTLRLPEKM